MRLRTAILSAAVLMTAPLLSAQTTTYYYTGADYNNVFNSGPILYTTSMDITGNFTTATLGDNLSNVNLNGSQAFTFTFSDGYQTVTSSTIGASVNVWDVSTDKFGNITSALIDIVWRGGDSEIKVNGTNNGGVYDAASYIDGSFAHASSGGPGTWSPTVTPEPSSFVLMLTALVGFGFAARKQLVPRLLPAMHIDS